MLSRIIRQSCLIKMGAMRFGASHGHGEHHDGHHDHDGHHGHDDHHHVDINQDATWIKLRGDRRLISINGIEDTHIPPPGLVQDEPFASYETKKYFDSNFFFFSEVFAHPIDHELHATGRQGYFASEDPNDTRFDLINPFYYGVATILSVAFFYFYSDLTAVSTSDQILSESLTIEARVGEVLKAKSQKIAQLQSEISGLRSQ